MKIYTVIITKLIKNMIKTTVLKRDGTRKEMDCAKIQNRLKYLAYGYPSKNESFQLASLDGVDVGMLTIQVIRSVVNNISTTQIDEEAAKICSELAQVHPDYSILASRIIISNHHKNTRMFSFMGVTDTLYRNPQTNLLSRNHYKFVERNHVALESMIQYDRDYLFSYFGFKTLERKYLLRLSNTQKPIERPQHMLMRIAIELGSASSLAFSSASAEEKTSSAETSSLSDLTNNERSLALDSPRYSRSEDAELERKLNHIKKTYDALSLKRYTHASPTIFNCGTDYKQCLSCFLLGSEDSRESIMKTGSDISEISKRAGGIGFHFNWRSEGSLIRGTNGLSSGPIPFVKMYDRILASFNQGGKRAGSGAAYMPIDHPDVEIFMELRIPHKSPELKAPDMFLAVSVPDLFMIRCCRNEDWNLFDPNECPMLASTYGKEYNKWYLQYEKEGRSKKKLKARDLAKLLAKCKIESGMPYTYYKDMCNRKSNQKNLGTIRSSNLCAEIIEYSDTKEYACCVLASICLPAFVKEEAGKTIFDFKELIKTVELAIINLDKIIDINTYPCVETKISNMRHRPLGLGVQGLADVYFKFNIPFDSKAAMELNSQIFETIYYASMNASCNIARGIYMDFRRILKKNKTVDIPRKYRITRSFIDEENFVLDERVEVDKLDKYILFSSEELCNSGSIASNTGDTGDTGDNINRILISSEKHLPTDVGAYSSYKGSPISRGKFQFDLWDDEYEELYKSYPDIEWYKSCYEKKLDWETLRNKTNKFGVRNSLVVALMPTASTAHIQGNNECFEPYTSNIYRREIDAGDFICVNKHLIKLLISKGIWSDKMKDQIIAHKGSIQYISEIPNDIKYIYRTAWEIPQKNILEQAANRAQFIDQSQSLNLFFGKQNKTVGKITSSIISAWKYRLKTQYYVRTQESNSAQNYTIDPVDEARYMSMIPVIGADSGCIACSG